MAGRQDISRPHHTRRTDEVACELPHVVNMLADIPPIGEDQHRTRQTGEHTNRNGGKRRDDRPQNSGDPKRHKQENLDVDAYPASAAATWV